MCTLSGALKAGNYLYVIVLIVMNRKQISTVLLYYKLEPRTWGKAKEVQHYFEEQVGRSIDLMYLNTFLVMMFDFHNLGSEKPSF